jgi:hypothetical protein
VSVDRQGPPHTFGENGERADQNARRYAVTLARDRYQQALDRGFVYSVRVPVKRPGADQLRIALRDVRAHLSSVLPAVV